MSCTDFNLGLVYGFLLAQDAPAVVMGAFQAVKADLQEQAPFSPPTSPLPPAPIDDTEDPERNSPVVVQLATILAPAADQPVPIPKDQPGMEHEGRGWPQWKKEKLLQMREAGCGPTEIAAAVGKTPSQVSQMIHYLTKHGRVERAIERKTGEVAMPGE